MNHTQKRFKDIKFFAEVISDEVYSRYEEVEDVQFLLRLVEEAVKMAGEGHAWEGLPMYKNLDEVWQDLDERMSGK